MEHHEIVGGPGCTMVAADAAGSSAEAPSGKRSRRSPGDSITLQERADLLRMVRRDWTAAIKAECAARKANKPGGGVSHSLALLVYHVLVDRIRVKAGDPDLGWCWPSLKSIASDLGYKSEGHISRAISVLECVGLIVAQRGEKRADGQPAPNRYLIVRDPGEPEPKGEGTPPTRKYPTHPMRKPGYPSHAHGVPLPRARQTQGRELEQKKPNTTTRADVDRQGRTEPIEPGAIVGGGGECSSLGSAEAGGDRTGAILELLGDYTAPNGDRVSRPENLRAAIGKLPPEITTDHYRAMMKYAGRKGKNPPGFIVNRTRNPGDFSDWHAWLGLDHGHHHDDDDGGRGYSPQPTRPRVRCWIETVNAEARRLGRDVCTLRDSDDPKRTAALHRWHCLVGVPQWITPNHVPGYHDLDRVLTDPIAVVSASVAGAAADRLERAGARDLGARGSGIISDADALALNLDGLRDYAQAIRDGGGVVEYRGASITVGTDGSVSQVVGPDGFRLSVSSMAEAIARGIGNDPPDATPREHHRDRPDRPEFRGDTRHIPSDVYARM